MKAEAGLPEDRMLQGDRKKQNQALLNLGMIHSASESLKFSVGAIHELPVREIHELPLHFGGNSYSKSATPKIIA